MQTSRLFTSAFLLAGAAAWCLAQEDPRNLAGPTKGPGSAATQPATAPATSAPATDKHEEPLSTDTLAGLAFRGIGPALMAGRIVDIAVDPTDTSNFYIAAASGGVWKTTNAGITWTPIFDGEGAYSIGCLTLDPRNPNVLWVGTGENNGQRSVGFGDGVYRTRDGGQSWENLGLRDSEHIGMIRVDPRDSEVVYVAAQGPLWRAGPERGLYKTTDGGKTWMPILQISQDTGVSEIHLDPRNPDVLYASAWQRRRHVWTFIGGGPESALYKSTDAGQTWRKIQRGLPDVDLGRIGLAVAPSNPDVVYAIVEAALEKGGLFRSMDRGETWEKRSDYMSSAPLYYNELFVDPTDAEHVYSMDTFISETHDGGKTWKHVPGTDRHVDVHALWINPHATDHMLLGCDGGLYETWDRGTTWRFFANLPITQFYRITADRSAPFYFVYGGTQDNDTQGGPTRTRDMIGIANEHWFITVGGDGFKTQVDASDPNIVYSQWQYGGLIRFDRRTGEQLDIKPREAPGEPPLRWNWDSPLIISHFDHRRLYFAAQRVFRSDNQGDAWRPVSPDLTRQIDRDKLKVMGRMQPIDAVARGESTSFYGNIVALAESPRDPNLLYVGTDDGLIQVTADGGATWRKVESFPGVPEMSYVSYLRASRHDTDVVYAAFDNHKMGDFKPYLLRSPDRGHTWKSIAGDSDEGGLPERNFVWVITEDPVESELLFVGTEFGVYFTSAFGPPVEGAKEAAAGSAAAPASQPAAGPKWLRLKGGLPTIAVKDLDIQERENDLVVGTFGRSVYVLDDYSPLRGITHALLAEPAHLFPVKTAWRYIRSSRLGGPDGKGTQGAAFYAAPNPPFGAVFTYYLKDKLETRRERRLEAEKKVLKAGSEVSLPSLAELRAEDEEQPPSIVLIVQDARGATVRRITGPREKGLHRVNWDLRYPSSTPIDLSGPKERAPWDEPPVGSLAPAGTYKATLAKEVDGEWTVLAGPQEFKVIPLEEASAAAGAAGAGEPSAESIAFRQKVARLQRAVQGAVRAADEAANRLKYDRAAIVETPGVDPALLAQQERLEKRLNELLIALRGDMTRGKRNFPTPPSILQRAEELVGGQWYVTSAPTQTQQEQYRWAGKEFESALAQLRELMDRDLVGLEQQLEAAGAPWTPGRVPTWQFEAQ